MIQLNATSSKKVTQSTYQKLLCLGLWPTIRTKVFLFFTWIKLESLKFYHEVLERKNGRYSSQTHLALGLPKFKWRRVIQQPFTAFSWTSKNGYLINNLTLHLKQLENEEMKKPRVSRRKEILKIMAEINAKETKETMQKSTKLKAGSLRR